MKWTNKHNLPQAIVSAITKDRYTDESEAPSDFSATGILSPVQQTILKRRHKENLMVRDVVDDFWAFLGSIAHSVLEEAYHESEGGVIEERLYAEVLGKTLSGKMDCYINGKIRDYKTTKVYKIIKGDFREWQKQLNIYAWLCRKNGWEVNSLEVVAIIFDWKEHETYKKNYPKCPFEIIQIALWSDEQCEEYIRDRISDLIDAEGLTEAAIAQSYPCSDEDMWSDIQDYAVFKQGATRATRKFDTMEEAVAFRDLNQFKGGDYYIEVRKTERTRCMKYCDVAHICVQHQEYLKLKEDDDEQGQPSDLLF